MLTSKRFFLLKYVFRYFINIVIDFFLNVRSLNMSFLFNVFFIVLLFLFQSNDILLLIFKKALLKVRMIIRF